MRALIAFLMMTASLYAAPQSRSTLQPIPGKIIAHVKTDNLYALLTDQALYIYRTKLGELDELGRTSKVTVRGKPREPHPVTGVPLSYVLPDAWAVIPRDELGRAILPATYNQYLAITCWVSEAKRDGATTDVEYEFLLKVEGEADASWKRWMGVELIMQGFLQ